MRNSFSAVFLELLLLSSVMALASAGEPTKWLTLSGNAPLVIARGGFSGLFPDSSYYAYSFALSVSLPDVVLWCDVQLTKDGAGICSSYLTLENSTSIGAIFSGKENSYVVNGVTTKGWFSIDFTLDDLANVYLTQGIFCRSTRFDGDFLPVLTVQDVVTQVKPPGLWLNIQHDQFFSQHKLSMKKFVISTLKSISVDYISSPELEFLTSTVEIIKGTKTRLVFRFLSKETREPTSNQTYGSLLGNLTFIKTFASGILVPKSFIRPVSPENYLLQHTSLVSDAHKVGLEVYASDFINDQPVSYNNSYDPIAETLQSIDNGMFSVDGLLTEFPITQSEAIG